VKIEWVLLAEGLGQDAKGAITALGLNQNILAAPSLPSTTKRAVIAHLAADDEPLETGDKITLRFSVTSPSGQVIAAQTAQATVGTVPWPDLPVTSDLPVEMLLTFNEYGTHRFEVAVQTTGGEELKGQIDFYVVTPAQSMAGGTEEHNMMRATETSREAANREWEEMHGTVTSLLAAITRIENHIKDGDTDAALATIARARKTADRNKVRDTEARAR
jgi:hypothetical protein